MCDRCAPRKNLTSRTVDRCRMQRADEVVRIVSLDCADKTMMLVEVLKDRKTGELGHKLVSKDILNQMIMYFGA